MVHTVSDLLPMELQGDDTAKAVRVKEAYKAFVDGRASRDDADLIMLDLAKVSGYYHVTPPGTSSDDVQRAEGARSVYARIVYMLNMPAPTMGEYLSGLAREPDFE